ncbi:MAG: ECF transporter S component [Oscillospiraceae bacterium]|jgi:uncharacterized membrane protein|nr:ECF transporter S component [Oscillospiraceae bacterium]
MKKNTGIFSVGKIVRLAVLVAILLVMGFTPLGYLKVNPVMTITFNMIPVVIGAVILGPTGGAILGIVFGLTSFSQALTGADALGAAILNQSALSAVLLFVMCVAPRFLAGWLPAFFYRVLDKHIPKRGRVISIALTSLCGSVLNTIFFVAAFIGFFGANELVTGAFGTTEVWTMITILITANAVVEAIVCTVVGGAIGQALSHYLPVNRKEA